SGVLSCPPDQFATTDGIRTFTGTVTDRAGNTTSVTSDPVRIDLGAPTITASLNPPPNASGWNNGPVSVHFACADGGSGIKTCPSDRIVTSEGFGQSVTGTAVDKAGNSAVAFANVSIDTTAPVLTFTTPTDGSTVQVSTIVAAGSAHDDLSGISSVTCNGTPAAVAGDMVGCNVSLARGANAIAASATDRAGNTTSLALSVSYARVPVARITSPDNLSYLNISPTTVTGTVDDDSAVVTVNSIPVPTANGVFTLALPLAEGPNVVTASATSPEGAAGTASIDITLDTTPPHVTITS